MFGICKQKRNKAFTLIELSVIIAVIATLSLILLVSFSRVRASSRDSQRSVQVALISESLEEYYDENGEYPTCSVMTQTPSVVISTLEHLNPNSLTTPTAPSGTNSIAACEGEPTTDVFHYIGGVSEYTLKYREEASGVVVSVKSRHSVPVPIPEVPTFPITVNPPVASVVVIDPPTKVHCDAGDPEYHFRYRIDDSSDWISPGDWVTDQASAAYNLTTKQGKKYGLQMQARCNQLGSIGSTLDSPEVAVIPPITASPTTPVVAVNTVADVSSWSWNDLAGVCTEETAVSYHYRYTVSPAGYDSGWVDYNNLSVDFTTITAGQTYTVEVQARCSTSFAVGSWSASGSASYVKASGGEIIGFKKISSTNSHTCAISSEEKAYCWGRNDSGSIGDGSTVDRSIPTAVSTSGVLSGMTIKSVSAGMFHSCALASDDNAYCWGLNNYGELGNGFAVGSSYVPYAVTRTGSLTGLTIKSIDASYQSTCAIASDNNAYCWGYNNLGQLGDGTTSNRPSPTPVVRTGALAGLTIKSISVGSHHTCVIASDNNAYCWGYNNLGQLGDGTANNSLLPIAVVKTGALAGLTIKSISAGDIHTCAIASNDKAYCWGGNSQGQLSNGSTVNSLLPIAIPTDGVLAGSNIKSIEVGYYNTCVITSDNKAYCTGGNGRGQIGVGYNGTDILTPLAVMTSSELAGLMLSSITVSESHICILASDDNPYCWGYNDRGRIGDGTLVDRYYPTSRSPLVTANTVSNTTTWSWTSASCMVPGQLNYRYRYTISPSGYDSGWVDNGVNQSVAFTTVTVGQTYRVEVQSKCAGSDVWGLTVYDDHIIETPLTALLPTGFETSTGVAPSSSTYTNINHTVAGFDGTYFVAGINSTGAAYYYLSDVPDNFSKIKSLTVNVRYRISALSNDNETLSVQVLTYDHFYPLTDELVIKNTTTSVTEVNSGYLNFTWLDSAASKSAWNGAVLVIKTTHSAVGGKDNSVWSINEIELGGTYQ